MAPSVDGSGPYLPSPSPSPHAAKITGSSSVSMTPRKTPTKSSADQALPETAIRSSGALAGSRQDICISTKAASPAAPVTGSIIHHTYPDNNTSRWHLSAANVRIDPIQLIEAGQPELTSTDKIQAVCAAAAIIIVGGIDGEIVIRDDATELAAAEKAFLPR